MAGYLPNPARAGYAPEPGNGDQSQPDPHQLKTALLIQVWGASNGLEQVPAGVFPAGAVPATHFALTLGADSGTGLLPAAAAGSPTTPSVSAAASSIAAILVVLRVIVVPSL